MTTTRDPAPLSAPYVLEYPYHRSTGPVIGAFLGALRDGRVVGTRTRDGRVMVPPAEYDENGEPTGDLVDVADRGVVTTWTWIGQPRPNHPLQRPFAFALIRLDGADTAMLHAVDADEASMRTGMRVAARWREQREGTITDIECFVPEAAP